MNTNFYLALKARVAAGQYKIADIIAELETRLGQGRIDDEQYTELMTLAEISVDSNFNGNKFPTHYDLEQDVEISLLDGSVVELYELLMGTVTVQTATQREKIAATFNAMVRSNIGDVYLKMVIDDRKKFSEVHETKQQEVADKLIALGRQDLIDDPTFLPVEELDPEFSVTHE